MAARSPGMCSKACLLSKGTTRCTSSSTMSMKGTPSRLRSRRRWSTYRRLRSRGEVTRKRFWPLQVTNQKLQGSTNYEPSTANELLLTTKGSTRRSSSPTEVDPRRRQIKAGLRISLTTRQPKGRMTALKIQRSFFITNDGFSSGNLRRVTAPHRASLTPTGSRGSAVISRSLLAEINLSTFREIVRKISHSTEIRTTRLLPSIRKI